MMSNLASVFLDIVILQGLPQNVVVEAEPIFAMGYTSQIFGGI